MKRRPSFTEARRRCLALRLAQLETCENRSMITESLGIMMLGIGMPAGLVSGRPRESAGSATPQIQAQLRDRSALGIPLLIAPQSRSGVCRPGRPVEVIDYTTRRPIRAASDWLTLSAVPVESRGPQVLHSSGSIDTPAQTGGQDAPGFGVGPTPATIQPLRIAAPSDVPHNPNVLMGDLSGTAGTNSTSSLSVGRQTSGRQVSFAVATTTGGSGGSIVSGGAAFAGYPKLVAPIDGGLGGGLTFNSVASQGSFDHFPLYTLDYNNGGVLFPGSHQYASLNGNMDLRAQVRDTTGVTFSWNTTGLTDATNISGTSTYRLQFRWKNSLPGGTNSVTLTATNGSSQQEVQTYTFQMPSGGTFPGSNGTATWPEALSPDLARLGTSYFASHNAYIDAAAGSLDTMVALPSYSPNIPPVVLAYDSLHADARPMIVERHVIDAAQSVPTKVSAQLTFNGTTGTTYYYDTSQFIPGNIQQIAVQADATALSTGRYDYSLSIGDVRMSTTTTTVNGTMSLLNGSSNEFGAGWTLQGLQKITAATGGLLLDLGQGNKSLWFTGSGVGSYTAPSGEFSTLEKNVGNTYTRTLTDGTKINFDTSGRQIGVVDLNNLILTYAYDSGGKLQTITDPYTKITTFTYDSGGKLQTITDPANRIATITHSGSNLTGVTLPDTNAWSFGYDGSGRMTQVTDPRSKTLTVTYDGAGRVSGTTRPDNTTETIVPYQVRGYNTSGTSSSPAPATLLAEARASYTDPNSHTTELRLDWRGQGLTNQSTDPDGYVSTVNRDSNGLATIVIDRLNRVSQAAYDGSGNITKWTYPDLNYDQYTYNGYSQPLTFRNARGKTTNYSYDGNGNLTVINDPLNNLTTLTYTGNGRVATVKDARLNVTTYQYDSQDRLTTITHPDANTQLFAYDSKGNPTTLTDERGKVTSVSYDAMNRMTGVTDALSNRTTVAYDASGNQTVVQRPLSRTTSYAYDALNRVTTVTDPLSHATVYGYDSGGNVKTVTDPLSRIVTLSYDAQDRPTVVIDPLGNRTTTTYDAEGQVTQVKDPLSRITTTTYNNRGWAETVTDPLGNVTTYTYTATGKVSKVSDPVNVGGNLVSITYDDDDRRWVVDDNQGHRTTLSYDAVGNSQGVKDPMGFNTTYVYDSRNRLTTITDPLSHSTVRTYDSAGNQIAFTDALGHTTTTAYDALNRPTTITDARGAVTTMAYDAAGRQTGLTDPNGNATTWAYDAADRVTTMTDPRGSTTTYLYDAADQLTDRTDRNGRRVTFAYDSGGRQTNERWLTASGGTVRTVSYTYNADNELTGVTDPDATLTFTYDSGGRQISAATSGTGGQPTVTLNYGYNATGDRTSMADSLGSAGLTTYLYDSAHRLTTITRSLGGTAGPQVAYTYDNNSRVTKVARTIGGSGTQVDSNLSYDNAGNVGTITYKVSGGGAPWATYAYSYDSANRLTSETNPEGTVAYSYDNVDQLTGVTGARSESYSYDSGGNRTMAGYSTTTGNRLSAGAGYTFTYDNEGNTTSKTFVATGDKTDFTWDYRNRLTGVVERNSGGTVIMQATYTYDPLGRRIGVNVDDDGAGPHAAVQSWTVYDGDNTYADFDGSGTLATRYLYGPAIDALLARTSSGGTTAWYMTDRLGSVRDVVDTSGTVLDHVSYDSYGNILTESNAGNGDRFKFTGMEFDSVAEAYSFRTGYYSSIVGRFISQDTSVFRTSHVPVSNCDGGSNRRKSDPDERESSLLFGMRTNSFDFFDRPERAITLKEDGYLIAQRRILDEAYRRYAAKNGHNVEMWAVINGLHDIRYRVLTRNTGVLGDTYKHWTRLDMNFFNMPSKDQVSLLLHEGYHYAYEYRKDDSRVKKSPTQFDPDRHYAEEFAIRTTKRLLADEETKRAFAKLKQMSNYPG